MVAQKRLLTGRSETIASRIPTEESQISQRHALTHSRTALRDLLKVARRHTHIPSGGFRADTLFFFFFTPIHFHRHIYTHNQGPEVDTLTRHFILGSRYRRRTCRAPVLSRHHHSTLWYRFALHHVDSLVIHQFDVAERPSIRI